MLIQWTNAQVYASPSPLLHTETSPHKCEGHATVRETTLSERLNIHLAAQMYTKSPQLRQSSQNNFLISFLLQKKSRMYLP